MRTFLYCEAGFVEKDQWLPNSWVNVECPTPEDIHYLTNQFNVPESFLSDIADTDERPRIEYEGAIDHHSNPGTEPGTRNPFHDYPPGDYDEQ